MGQVQKLDRTTLVADKDNPTGESTNVTHNFKMILDYNVQHKKFERIIAKNWSILKQDKVLGPVLPEKPQFIYKKAPSLRDRLAPSVLNPPVVSDNRLFKFLGGFYACGRCVPCKNSKVNLKKRKKCMASATNREYNIKQLITCDTIGVVYMLECDCGLQYIGRTSRPLHVRLAEHVNNIKQGKTTHNVSRHFKQFHHKNPKGLRFWGIEKVNRHWRGGNFIRQLSKKESYWIHETHVLIPDGLNVDFDINCFISDR